MSRQRLRTGVLEASTKPCPHCEGTGLMRTAASAGLSALRIIEDEAARGRGDKILLRAGREAAVFLLNKKRSELADIEQRYGVSIEVAIDETFEGARMTVENSGPRPTVAPRIEAPALEPEEDEDIEITLEEEEEEEEAGEAPPVPEGERQGRRRRRRRRGGRGRREAGEAAPPEDMGTSSEAAVPSAVPGEAGGETAADASRSRRRRRGRKSAAPESQATIEPDSSPMVERPIDEEPPIAETQPPIAETQPPIEEPKPKRRRSRKGAPAEADVTASIPAPAEIPPAESAAQSVTPAKPARKRKTKAAEPAAAESAAPAGEPTTVPSASNDTADENGEPRRGWWQRTFG